ncbi:MAG: hypothetical protein U9O86_08895 [Campylobacterota bacterium]|nr:hypothetical protein [Campylobacterota bacterium]
MEIVQNKAFKKPIVLLKILNDGRLLVVDNETTIRYLNRDDFSTLDGFKVNIHHQRYKSHVVSFSNDGDYFASLTSSCKESRLYSAKSKKLIAEVDRHHGEASTVGIDPLNRYMFSCGDDGKTFAIDIKSGQLVFTLPVHVDTVNDIAFSENGNWVATASYDRKISIFSLVTMSPKDKLRAHAAPIMKLRFLAHNRLISIDKNSSAIIWNIYTGKIIERLQGIHDDVTHVTTSKDDQFLFLGTALGYILVYDLKTYELLSPKYIKISSPITALEFDKEKDMLIVGTEDGFLMMYDIYEGVSKISDLLKEKRFDDIQLLKDENPILAYTEIFSLVANLWERTLVKAKLALEKGDKKKAILLFNAFKNMPSKNKVMQKVLTDYAEFDKFKAFATQGKLPLAYGLANQFPIYKDTKLYHSLEERWKKVFLQAQKYVLDPKGIEKAKEIFAPYRGISSKTKLVQELLTKAKVYKRFRVAIGQKDFAVCFELIKQHNFLKELPEYNILMKYADTLYIKSQKLMQSDDTHSAVKMLRILSVFEDYKDEVKELLVEIETKQKFFNAIKEEDTISAYNMMAISESLEDTPEGQVLQENWLEAQKNANSFAVEGDSQGVTKALSAFMKISSKSAAIATVYAWCYMVQLEDKARSNTAQHSIENGIKNFVLNFGVQDNIEHFYTLFKEKYPSSKLTLEHLPEGSMSMWRPSMVVESILD